MKNKQYIAIKGGDNVLNRLRTLGYTETKKRLASEEYYKWVFISICNGQDEYGAFVGGSFHDEYDIEINIDNIPLREELENFVKLLNNGIMMGLL